MKKYTSVFLWGTVKAKSGDELLIRIKDNTIYRIIFCFYNFQRMVVYKIPHYGTKYI